MLLSRGWRSAGSAVLASSFRAVVSGVPQSRRITRAVGDQARDQVRTGTEENDADWIKVQDYVRGINPRFLKDAQAANAAAPWKGEGIVEQAYSEPAVEFASAVTVDCSDPRVAEETLAALQCIAGQPRAAAGETGEVNLAGTRVRVRLMDSWVRRFRAFRGHPATVRVTEIDFVPRPGLDLDAARSDLSARGVEAGPPNQGVCTLAAPGAKGLLPDALVSKWAALRRDAALPCALQLAAPASAPAPPATSDGLGAVVKEIVVGASWVQHGAAERMLDRICGADARDGVRTLVLHVADTEAALGRLKQGGFRIVEFPKYLVVDNLGGLDLRLAATQEVDKFYTEVRWEVAVERNGSLAGPSKGRNDNVSCIGAITHGGFQAAVSGTLSKKMRS